MLLSALTRTSFVLKRTPLITRCTFSNRAKLNNHPLSRYSSIEASLPPPSHCYCNKQYTAKKMGSCYFKWEETFSAEVLPRRNIILLVLQSLARQNCLCWPLSQTTFKKMVNGLQIACPLGKKIRIQNFSRGAHTHIKIVHRICLFDGKTSFKERSREMAWEGVKIQICLLVA